MPRSASRQPNICFSSVPVLHLVRKFLLLFNNGPLTHSPLPVTVQNNWLRASSTSRYFLRSSCFLMFLVTPPAINILSSHCSSSSCITRKTVDFGIPVTSVSQLWLMFGHWLLVCPSKAVLLDSIKSLRGILAGVQNFTKSRVVLLSSISTRSLVSVC